MKTVVVTGGNRGIGRAVARELITRGCRVVLHARDRARGERALEELRGAGPGEVTLVTGDLSTKRGIRETADAILAACPRIDVLIHNAGLWPSERILNEDGLEMAFVVNHLAPFMLNHLLEARLVESRSRVVQVSAGLYVKGRPDLEKTPTGEDFQPLGTYPTTKLCNLLLVPRFAARWKERGPTILALHPGVIRTGLGDRKGMLGRLLRVVKRLWKSPEEGARPVVRLALDPALDGVTGRYYHLDVETELLPIARDEALAAKLWSQAEKLSEVLEAG
ncbi:SDR family NAD(P)-dependent oxidoreductase [Polyangium sp. 6x1]|uniref:SDR family NAD(P)-dependent oxidoreductase n=1 Tax=Polyangium sp. 6x1 TaxID=3042689 RepID=UPI002483200F|nr:SDR family NAD(P)-dependent oxidoreductase [Polyangium sp. 6x1]MDI1446856.1 SDR family NAD(P)-dependent oxidoreductase [Polyangium sp. 6x1]